MSSAGSSADTLPALTIPYVYSQLATLPDVTGAWITSPLSSSLPPTVLVATSVRDLSVDAKRDYHTVHAPHPTTHAYSPLSFPTLTDVLLHLPSPSLSLVLIIRKLPTPTPPPPSSPPQYLLDVLSAATGRLLSSTPTTNVHARLLLSGLMGGVRWSDAEDAVLYSAEPMPPVTKGSGAHTHTAARCTHHASISSLHP